MPCIPVFEDNHRAIQLAQFPSRNASSKHIDVRHHVPKELEERKELLVFHVSWPYQLAHFLTQRLPNKVFESHRNFV